jgi:hypothetical protein
MALDAALARLAELGKLDVANAALAIKTPTGWTGIAIPRRRR